MPADTQQLTPWFSGRERPGRVGVYERIEESIKLHDFSLWDGRRWMIGHATPEQADNLVMYESLYQPTGDSGFSWRGFTEEQK